MHKILVDVDTQYDFVSRDGALYVPMSVERQGFLCQALSNKSYDAIIGSVDSHAWDAWEFQENGGPFPPHCVKGSKGWCRVWGGRQDKTRFIPMQTIRDCRVAMEIGEIKQGSGNRLVDESHLSQEALSGVSLYFEKEVYSLFSNPAAELIIAEMVKTLGGKDKVQFDVMGYCTGGFCVDEAAAGLAIRGYHVRILGYATAPLGGEEGEEKSRQLCKERGIEWVESP